TFNDTASDLYIHPEPLAWQFFKCLLILFGSLAFGQFFSRITATLTPTLLVALHLFGFLTMSAIQFYRAFLGARLHRCDRCDIGSWLDHVLLCVDLNDS